MAKLKNYNGRYCENDYEYAFIGFLEAEGWQYIAGDSIKGIIVRKYLLKTTSERFYLNIIRLTVVMMFRPWWIK